MARRVNAIDGCRYVRGGTRRIDLPDPLPDSTLAELLHVLWECGEDFGFDDERYPSPSDPGACFSYSPSETAGKWRMTLGNHGWTGGIYEIDEDTIRRQLQDLIAKKLLRSIEVGDVCFFSRKSAEGAAASRAMNKKLLRIHPPDRSRSAGGADRGRERE
ncbi:MAG TPA: hypothetical protein VD866_24515 [Urbifossiella sp.]|nr:hypothetical protein [Urbifossiella sp.]